MVLSFGKDWRSQFRSFEDRPFAAASIGQVRPLLFFLRGISSLVGCCVISTCAFCESIIFFLYCNTLTFTGPQSRPLRRPKSSCEDSVPRSCRRSAHRCSANFTNQLSTWFLLGIDSDIDNLVSVLSIGGLFPKGLFLEKFVEVALIFILSFQFFRRQALFFSFWVARKELAMECDYMREARAMKKFRELLADSKDFFIPEVWDLRFSVLVFFSLTLIFQVVDSLTTNRVLTAEYVVGKPVDKCVNEPQIVRDYIAGKFIELCLKEVRSF